MASWIGSVRGGFGGFEKSQLVEFWFPGRTVGFRGSPKQASGLVAGAHVVLGRWKS